MSEYQYYEFRAVDRHLTERQMNELGRLSSRAEITPTSFVNEYHFGDFRGDPRKVLEKYFDAFVYVANWGTRRLALRLPAASFDAEYAGQFARHDCLTIRKKARHVIVEFVSEDEGGSWEEGGGWMGSLLPLRDELLGGDYRSLYLGWLLGVCQEDLDDDDSEPHVPAGLAKPSRALKKLIEFLRIDRDLVAVAAKCSPTVEDTAPSRTDVKAWIGRIPPTKKNEWLLRLLEEEKVDVRRELLQQFRDSCKSGSGKPSGGKMSAPSGRTAGELRALYEAAASKRNART